jgi:DNA-directed RNA polymerase subunit RPC12/RpoP
MTTAYPGSSLPPLTPSSQSRKCSNCSSPLESLGVKAVPTLEYNGHPAGAFVLETYHCAHCGKVEFFTPR